MALVAVIMPCHNGERTLRQAVESVLAQTFTDWELVIVDDGSTDGSASIIEQMAAAEPRIRLLRNTTPSGAAAARNRALRETYARYVAFLDSDDAWLPDKLQVQLRAMQDSGAALACSSYDVMDGDGKITGTVHADSGKLTYHQALGYNPIGCLTVVLDRSLCGAVQFDPTLPRSEDYQLWLSILRQGLIGISVSDTLGLYRVHGKSLSSNKLAAARCRWLVYRGFERLGLLASTYYFIVYAATGVVKMLRMRQRRFLSGSALARRPVSQ
jgi:teichuronic acid biosynthesis glycosyltransferase TuaG